MLRIVFAANWTNNSSTTTLDDGFTYKTIVSVHFILQDDTENASYYFEFDKVSVGNLPIPKSLITSILDAVGVDIETGGICDTFKSYVWEPQLIKLNAQLISISSIV